MVKLGSSMLNIQTLTGMIQALVYGPAGLQGEKQLSQVKLAQLVDQTVITLAAGSGTSLVPSNQLIPVENLDGFEPALQKAVKSGNPVHLSINHDGNHHSIERLTTLPSFATAPTVAEPSNQPGTPTSSNSLIQVRYLGGISATQRAVFEQAAARWSGVIRRGLPSATVDSVVVTGVLITAFGSNLGGPGGILGQSGPVALRPGSMLPATGMMEFDLADLESLEADGSLLNVVIHEMGHVLGIGTLWGQMGLVQGIGTPNPLFVGTNAMREFATLVGTNNPTPVPLETVGGAGTRDTHWSEVLFGNEVMTGFLGGGLNPFSRLTIAALQDMGYPVNFNAADPYVLPAVQRSLMGINTARITSGNQPQCLRCNHRIQGTKPFILSVEMLS